MFYYAIGLLLLFFVFLIGEFFVPSAGMIGVAALICAVGAVVCGFSHSILMGIVMMVAVGGSTPAVLYFMIRMWPHTPIGRRILNRRPGQDGKLTPKRTIRDGTPLANLVGQIGVAQTDLLPSGAVLIHDQKLDAISLGMLIDAGTNVVVVKTVAGKIHVRQARHGEVARPTSPESATSPKETGQSSDAIQEPSADAPPPLKSFDLDSLD